MSLFKKKIQQLPTDSVVYPVGSTVRTESGIYYIKSNTIRMRIPTERVAQSWRFHRIISSNEVALKKYKIMGKMGFRSGSLIYNVADGKIYLVSENKLRHVTSPEALERIGAVFNDAFTVSNDETKLHQIGEDLS